MTSTPTQHARVHGYLFIAMDDDGCGNPEFCQDRAAVLEAVKRSCFSNPESLDEDHLRQCEGMTDSLIEDGFITFEGDPPLHLYKLHAPAQPSGLRFPVALRKMWSGTEVQAWLDQQGELIRLSDIPEGCTPTDARVLREANHKLADDLAAMEARKDSAYLERNQVVAALAKAFPAGVARTAIEGWSEDWHGCVYIDLPTGQASWHFHDSQAHLFDGLPPYTKPWDGHSTEQKYQRLAALSSSESAEPGRAEGVLEREERAHTATIIQRDLYHDIADELADRISQITGVDIGEHSSNNDPWMKAKYAADEFLASRPSDAAAVAWEYRNEHGNAFLTHSDPNKWHPHDRAGFKDFRALAYTAPAPLQAQPAAEGVSDTLVRDLREIAAEFQDRMTPYAFEVLHKAADKLAAIVFRPGLSETAAWNKVREEARELSPGRGIGDLLAAVEQYGVACTLSQPPAPLPAIEVWFGSMPESNGRENWTVTLRRKERPENASKSDLHRLMSGVSVYRSEYKDRARYEADRLRFLLGEIDQAPDILAYDADLHSGYVEPPSSLHQPRDVGALEYEGSIVSDIHQRMQRYHDELERCWAIVRSDDAGLGAAMPLHKALEIALRQPQSGEALAELARQALDDAESLGHPLCGASARRAARESRAELLAALASQPAPAVVAEPASVKQQKLRDLADRIDHEELWRRPALEHRGWTQDMRDRLAAGVALRRYSDLLPPGRWLIFSPTGSMQFSAAKLDDAVRMAKKEEARLLAQAAGEREPLTKCRHCGFMRTNIDADATPGWYPLRYVKRPSPCTAETCETGCALPGDCLGKTVQENRDGATSAAWNKVREEARAIGGERGLGDLLAAVGAFGTACAGAQPDALDVIEMLCNGIEWNIENHPEVMNESDNEALQQAREFVAKARTAAQEGGKAA